MDSKELMGLVEAYQEVYAPQEEIEEGLKPLPKEKMARQAQRAQGMENRAAASGDEKETNRQMQRRIAMQMPSSRRTVLDKKKMGEEVEIDEAVKGESSERRKALAAERKAGHRPKSAKEGENYASHKIAQMDYVKRQRMGEEVEIFDVVLEFLQAEGYAETLEEAEWLMANVIDEEAIEIILGEEQLDEISQKLATKAYAQSATGEFEGHDDASDVKRTDNLRKHIKRKFGDKAAEDADRHADSETFGRKDPRTGKRQPKPESRFQNANKYRTRSDGKMHGQDQNKLKAKLKRRIGEEYMDEAQDATPPKGQSKYGRKAPAGYMQTRKPTLQQMSSREKQAWRDRGIGEEYMDEAQAARENPEKANDEYKKKYGHVRGERTPMPPPGSQRRDEFEKWYAANVR